MTCVQGNQRLRFEMKTSPQEVFSKPSTHLFGSHGLEHLLQQDPHLLDVVHQHARLQEVGPRDDRGRKQGNETMSEGSSRVSEVEQRRFLHSTGTRREDVWSKAATHDLLLLTVGGEALGQQGAVLQQHFGDRLQGTHQTHTRHMFDSQGNIWRNEPESWCFLHQVETSSAPTLMSGDALLAFVLCFVEFQNKFLHLNLLFISCVVFQPFHPSGRKMSRKVSSSISHESFESNQKTFHQRNTENKWCSFKNIRIKY